MNDRKPPNPPETWPPWAPFAYLALLIVALPWYFPEGNAGTLVFGIPAWAATSLAASIMISLLTARLVWRYWNDDDGDRHGL